ncbi:hypothetical protein EJ110_NYTH57836 [Nymphaea thermarum]|nr:hypothetical protein EJ110_NYTH57836 [Nymphaea thermarum]
MKKKRRWKISPRTLKQKKEDKPDGNKTCQDHKNFFEFSRKNLMKFRKTQLMDMVRRLKKKYENIVVREKSGKTMAFKTSHEPEALSI